jgi:hypothetical protein
MGQWLVAALGIDFSTFKLAKPVRRLEPLELLERLERMNSQTGDFKVNSFSVSFMFSE